MKKLGKFVGGEESLILSMEVKGSDLDGWVGKHVRFKRELLNTPEGLKRMGTLARDETYEVGGVQRLYDESLGLRIFTKQSETYPYEDAFGRPARPEELEVL